MRQKRRLQDDDAFASSETRRVKRKQRRILFCASQYDQRGLGIGSGDFGWRRGSDSAGGYFALAAYQGIVGGGGLGGCLGLRLRLLGGRRWGGGRRMIVSGFFRIGLRDRRRFDGRD
jgi:hypothetical protein